MPSGRPRPAASLVRSRIERRTGANSMTAVEDTIFALSSGSGRSGVAVIRVSGPQAAYAVETLTGKPPPRPRLASYRRLTHPGHDTLIDRGLVLYFAAPRSVTGEEMAEFQVHGGRAVLAAMVDALQHAGLRPAVAGEFTRRAFANGKLDLTEVEGLADLVAAETEAQRRQAMRQMSGALGRLYDDWRRTLIKALAVLEAAIDFADEDLPATLVDRVDPLVGGVESAIANHLADGRRGERLRDGVSMAILGLPNVGKSSLLNALARRDAAIVSETSGTTRDVIEVRLDLDGVPVTLMDTAGLRENTDAVETEGVRRARRHAEEADLRLWVFDIREGVDGLPPGIELRADDVLVANKLDLFSDVAEGAKMPPRGPVDPGASVFAVSLKEGLGVAALVEGLADRVRNIAEVSEAPALTRQRHRTALEACRAALMSSRDRGGGDLALWAENIRLAARHLGRLTGRVDVEDVLDAIFSEFCIGK